MAVTFLTGVIGEGVGEKKWMGSVRAAVAERWKELRSADKISVEFDPHCPHLEFFCV